MDYHRIDIGSRWRESDLEVAMLYGRSTIQQSKHSEIRVLILLIYKVFKENMFL